MAGDMVVALGSATVEGRTLFAHNSDRPLRDAAVLQLAPGRAHEPGEQVAVQCLEVPQTRQTYTVLGSQPVGFWGYSHGVNEHGIAVGCTTLRSKLTCDKPALLGTDLVRLALERSRNAHQAADLITDLIERHGQGIFPNAPPQVEGDNAFLIAGPTEAFVVEAAGHHWASQEILQVRAVSDVGTIRQDWARISRGLSAHVIGHGWWPADGSKIDSTDSVQADALGKSSALRRWGRATFLLEQQNGHIDVSFLRRLLGDHYEGMQGEVDPFGAELGPTPICQHGVGAGERLTSASLVAPLAEGADHLPMAWCSFGPPCLAVFFPVFLDGELPAAFGEVGHHPGVRSLWTSSLRLHEQLRRNPRRLPLLHETFGRLQERFDQEVEEFSAGAVPLKKQGNRGELQRRAALFMQHTIERFDEALESLPRLDHHLVASSLDAGEGI